MREYLKVDGKYEYGTGNDIFEREDLTENFFIFLENHPKLAIFNYRRLNWTTAVLDKRTFEIMPYAYSSDAVNELPFFPRTSKFRCKVPEPIGEYDINTRLDITFHILITELNLMHRISSRSKYTYDTRILREDKYKSGSQGCLYIKNVLYSNIRTPEFCPIPGILLQFYNYNNEIDFQI